MEGRLGIASNKQEEMGPNESVLEIKRVLGRETNRAYNKLIDYCLGDNDEAEAKKDLKGLPSKIQKLYEKVYSRIKERINRNASLDLSKDDNDKISFLTRPLLDTLNAFEDQEKLRGAFSGAKYFELTKGIPIIEAESKAFEDLEDLGLIFPSKTGTEGVHFSINSLTSPNFLMIEKPEDGESLAENPSKARKHPGIRHEVSHVLWTLMQEDSSVKGETETTLIRKSNEENEGRRQAFDVFRNELAAYLISKHDITHLSPESLIYSKDKEALGFCVKQRNYAAYCLRAAKEKGVDPEDFVYACMASRNFDELKKNFTHLAPIDKVDEENVAALIKGTRKTGFSRTSTREFINNKNLKIPEQIIRDVAVQEMKKQPEMDDVLTYKYRLEAFSLAVFGEPTMDKDLVQDENPINAAAILQEALRPRLTKLPEATQKAILQLCDKDLLISCVSLDKNASEFLERYIDPFNFEKVGEEGFASIIKSSPEMHEEFKKLRQRLIKKDARRYKDFYGSQGLAQKNKGEKKFAEFAAFLSTV